MIRQLIAATRALLVLTLLLGVAYPLAVTGLALALPAQAKGSVVSVDGREVGSSLLGQATTDPRWFWARPSVSNDSGDTSGGSNWGPSAPQLAADIAAREARLRAADPQTAPSTTDAPLPADALSSSASGLDPDISPAYAALQAPGVAQARGLPLAQVQQLIAAHTTSGELGFLGAPRVNVTTLNVALAALAR